MNKSSIWFRRGIALSVMLFLFGGCTGVEKKPPEKRRFVLDVTRQGDASSSGSDLILGVRQIRVSPPYDGNAFVYRISDIRYEADHNNEFFITLSPMLTKAVLQWLNLSGLFEHVIDRTSPTKPTHFLEGTLVSIYGDYRDRRAPMAVLGMQFLLQSTSGQSGAMLQKQYQMKAPVTGEYPEGLVNAWNGALEQILTELEADLRTALTQ